MCRGEEKLTMEEGSPSRTLIHFLTQLSDCMEREPALTNRNFPYILPPPPPVSAVTELSHGLYLPIKPQGVILEDSNNNFLTNYNHISKY
jgi:hypothetical protein